MSNLGTLIDPQTIRFERRLPGPIERVWGYLTQSGYLADWLAEGHIEPCRGGRVELHFGVDEAPQRSCAGAIVRGAVTACEPPRLLEYSWSNVPAEPPNVEGIFLETAVTFELEEQGAEVLLMLTHRDLPSVLVPNFAAGWHAHLAILQSRLRREEPEPFLSVFDEALPKYEQLTNPAN